MELLPVIYASLAIFAIATIVVIVISYISFKFKKKKKEAENKDKSLQNVIAPQVKIVVQKSGKPQNSSIHEKKHSQKTHSIPKPSTVRPEKNRMEILNKTDINSDLSKVKSQGNKKENSEGILNNYDDNF